MKRLLRAWLWLLLASLGVGLAVGTCVRREAEQPVTYIGDGSTPNAAASQRAIASIAESSAQRLATSASS